MNERTIKLELEDGTVAVTTDGNLGKMEYDRFSKMIDSFRKLCMCQNDISVNTMKEAVTEYTSFTHALIEVIRDDEMKLRRIEKILKG